VSLVVGIAASAIPSAFAQSAPPGGLSGTWTAGPDASGANTYIGRIETPRARQSVAAGANLLVSGWAADTTAAGWAGFDQMQVYSGARDKGGIKLVDGTVGQARPDVADAFGAFGTSGFSAVVPASALGNLSGSTPLYVYLHTPNKGWWYKTVSAVMAPAATLPFPNDPVLVWLHPENGVTITRQQFLNRYVLTGYALDRNPITDPANQTLGPAQAGISSVNIYLDGLPGDPNSVPLGTAFEGIEVGVNNPPPHPGPLATYPSFPTITRQYGPQFEFAGWVLSWNTTQVEPDRFHTLYAVARSSITGRTSTASTQLFVKNATPGASCSVLNVILKKNCVYLFP
jgi:hypothetical protein